MDEPGARVRNEISNSVITGNVVQAGEIHFAAAPPSPEDVAAAKLAKLVGDQWREESRLRDLDGVRRIPVRWRTVGGGASGDAKALAAAFRARADKRMVIVGGAGTGKTSFAVALVRELVADRSPGEPVPVLVSAAGWSVEEHPDVRGWFVEQLERTYTKGTGLRADVLAELVSDGRVSMILDGLDELPAAARAVAVEALNDRFPDGDQLVVTCRTDEYGQAPLLGDVLVVEPEPVSPAVAADYLERVLPGWSGAPAIRAGAAGGVSEVVTTAFGLWLVGVAGGDDLVALPSAEAVRARLLDRLVPVLVARRRPDQGSSRWVRFRRKHRVAAPSVTRRVHDPVDVEDALGQLAVYLDDSPFGWWELADDVRSARGSRWVYAVFAAVSGLFGVVSFTAEFLGSSGFSLVPPVLGLVIGAAVGLFAARSSRKWAWEPPAFANFRFRGRFRTTVKTTLTIILVWGMMTVAGLLLDQSTATVVGWYALCVLYGISDWMESPSPEDAPLTPMDTWRADRRVNLVRWALIVAMLPVVLGFRVDLGFAPLLAGATSEATPFLMISMSAWAVVVVVAVAGSHRAWMGYLMATTRLAASGTLPRNLMPFLDDAHRMGLLRAVGPVYEFRHAYVRTYLAGKFVRRFG